MDKKKFFQVTGIWLCFMLFYAGFPGFASKVNYYYTELKSLTSAPKLSEIATDASVSSVTIDDITITGGALTGITNITADSTNVGGSRFTVGSGTTGKAHFISTAADSGVKLYQLNGDAYIEVYADDGNNIQMYHNGSAGYIVTSVGAVSLNSGGIAAGQSVVYDGTKFYPNGNGTERFGTAAFRWSDSYMNQVFVGDTTTGDKDAIINFADDGNTSSSSIKFDDGDTEFHWTINGNLAMQLGATGILYVDDTGSGSAAQVDLFDDYNDIELIQFYVNREWNKLPINMFSDSTKTVIKHSQLRQLIGGALIQLDKRIVELERLKNEN